MSEANVPTDTEAALESAPSEERAVWEALRTVEDPELPVSIVDLGLIYDVEVRDGHASVDLTLTYSGCPARDIIVQDAEDAVLDIDDVDDVTVTLVHSPVWSYERITAEGRRRLTEHGLAVPGNTDAPDPNCHD